jgi:hypothetical protein
MKNYLVPAFAYPHKIWPKSEIINQNFVHEKILEGSNQCWVVISKSADV